MGAATLPQVIQSKHPLSQSPKVIGLGGLIGTTTLPGPADNSMINVQPMAGESESAELQSNGLIKLPPHLYSGDDPLERTRGAVHVRAAEKRASRITYSHQLLLSHHFDMIWRARTVRSAGKPGRLLIYYSSFGL